MLQINPVVFPNQREFQCDWIFCKILHVVTDFDEHNYRNRSRKSRQLHSVFWMDIIKLLPVRKDKPIGLQEFNLAEICLWLLSGRACLNGQHQPERNKKTSNHMIRVLKSYNMHLCWGCALSPALFIDKNGRET